ncbi:Uncharacterised protein [Klebsiella quasipneumoniae]|nr:Uncharacterised protein [Klebsiella quasipneumoniae]
MSRQFRPNREETFNQTISKVLRIILNFVIISTAFQHHDCCPGNNYGKKQLDIRPKAKQTGTDRNENSPEDDSANDPPIQNPVTVTVWYREP